MRASSRNLLGKTLGLMEAAPAPSPVALNLCVASRGQGTVRKPGLSRAEKPPLSCSSGDVKPRSCFFPQSSLGSCSHQPLSATVGDRTMSPSPPKATWMPAPSCPCALVKATTSPLSPEPCLSPNPFSPCHFLKC